MDKCHKIASLGKKGREDISTCQDSYFWSFVGMFPVFSKDQAFSWETKFLGPPLSPYSSCTEADSLQPACRQPHWNSQHSTEVNILSQGSSLWTHAHIVLSSSLWGQVGRGMREILLLHFGCADWVSCWTWDESLGVAAASQHCMSSYWAFIWVVCWSQGTAFYLSKKAMQYYLILSCIKCTDCFMNHCSLLIQFLNRV